MTDMDVVITWNDVTKLFDMDIQNIKEGVGLKACRKKKLLTRFKGYVLPSAMAAWLANSVQCIARDLHGKASKRYAFWSIEDFATIINALTTTE